MDLKELFVNNCNGRVQVHTVINCSKLLVKNFQYLMLSVRKLKCL